MDKIEVRGARTHNLKNINLVIPRDKLIVVTGLSGSGKSSLAFDTLYAEGQRRYVESLSAYARQFLSLMEKPDVDHIEGLSPAISIEQKSTSHNPRSTVGTITEIHDYLRLLYARVGEPRCPDHDVPLAAQTVSQMVDNVLAQPEGLRLMLLAPIIKERKGEHTKTLENLASQGYIRARIDGEVCDLSDPPKLELQKKHTIEVVIDRFKVRDDLAQRLAEDDRGVLDRVVGIDVHVAGGLDLQVEGRVGAQGGEHVVVERDRGVDVDLTSAVEVEFDQHRRLLGGALDPAEAGPVLEGCHWLVSSRTALLAARNASFSAGVPMVTRRCPVMPTSRISTSWSRYRCHARCASANRPNRTKLAS